MAADPLVRADPGRVLAKATTRAGALLGLDGAALARVIGVNEQSLSLMVKGHRPLRTASKKGEFAVMLVRVCRALDALVGQDDGNRVAWMATHNSALGGVPRDLVQTAQGLVMALIYLEGMRDDLRSAGPA